MSDEINKEALREEVDRIKKAMGIQERYPAQVKSWLLWGSLIGAACFLSQIVAVKQWPGYLYAVIWWVLMGAVGGPLQAKISKEHEGEIAETGTKPRLSILYVVVIAAAFVFVANISPLFEGLGYYEIGAYIFTTIMVLIGVYYVVLGNQLRAYYVRSKDRYALYIAGAWLLALSGLVPHFPILTKWMYAIYGVTFGAYSLGAYRILSAR